MWRRCGGSHDLPALHEVLGVNGTTSDAVGLNRKEEVGAGSVAVELGDIDDAAALPGAEAGGFLVGLTGGESGPPVHDEDALGVTGGGIELKDRSLATFKRGGFIFHHVDVAVFRPGEVIGAAHTQLLVIGSITVVEVLEHSAHRSGATSVEGQVQRPDRSELVIASTGIAAPTGGVEGDLIGIVGVVVHVFDAVAHEAAAGEDLIAEGGGELVALGVIAALAGVALVLGVNGHPNTAVGSAFGEAVLVDHCGIGFPVVELTTHKSVALQGVAISLLGTYIQIERSALSGRAVITHEVSDGIGAAGVHHRGRLPAAVAQIGSCPQLTLLRVEDPHRAAAFLPDEKQAIRSTLAWTKGVGFDQIGGTETAETTSGDARPAHLGLVSHEGAGAVVDGVVGEATTDNLSGVVDVDVVDAGTQQFGTAGQQIAVALGVADLAIYENADCVVIEAVGALTIRDTGDHASIAATDGVQGIGAVARAGHRQHHLWLGATIELVLIGGRADITEAEELECSGDFVGSHQVAGP